MAKRKIRDPDITNVDLVDRPANPGARIMLFKRDGEATPTKTEDGAEYPAKAYAYVPDPEKPSTWKLRLWDPDTRAISARQVGRAIAALGKGFRGQKVEIPAEDLSRVKSRVRAAWKEANPDKEADEMPEIIAKKIGLLHLIAKKLGLTDQDIEEVEAVSYESVRKATEDLWDYAGALQESICSVLKDETVADKVGMVDGSLDQFHATIMSAVPIWLQGEPVAKAGKAISADRLARLKQAVQSLQAIIAEGEKGDEGEMAEINKASLSKDVQEYITKLESDIETLKKNAVPPKKDDSKPEDVLKALDPAVKKMFDDMEARTKAAEEIAKKVLDENTTKTFVAKAASYAHLGIKAEEFGPILKAISEKTPEAIEKLDAVLKAADEAVSKGDLFKEVGSSRSGGSGGGVSATWNKIQESARNYVAKAGTPMSDEQAVTKFLETKEGNALYTEYLKERSGK